MRHIKFKLITAILLIIFGSAVLSKTILIPPLSDTVKETENSDTNVENTQEIAETYGIDYSEGIKKLKENLPEYTGEDVVLINDNQNFFTEEERNTSEEFETYSGLDDLGRCQTAYANISLFTMPTFERSESLSEVKPTGYQVKIYPEISNGGNLYNRCHLIAFCLASEEVNEYNLITGTRQMNEAMAKYVEIPVAKFVETTGNHVLYRVTPIFIDNELVARGVLVETYSVEDQGKSFNDCAYFFNSQSGITIDYQTGNSEYAKGE